jgi:hypothetical protein
MSGTVADREGGQKEQSKRTRPSQAERDELIAQGLDPDRTEQEALAHRGGALVDIAEAAAAVPGVVIEPTEEAA